MSFEGQIVSTIQQIALSSPFFHGIAIFLARWLIFIFPIFGLFPFVSKKATHRHAVVEGAWSLALTLAVTAAVAFLIQRDRPFLGAFEADVPITHLIPAPLNTSFPSGHAGASFAVAAAIFFAHRPLGIVAFCLASLVAVGRMAVGVHYPSDILGGALVGLGCFALVRFLHHHIRRHDIQDSIRHHQHR